jgi:hypothetical protein
LAADVGAPTLKLALIILRESFKLDQMVVKEIVLSQETTGMRRKTRMRAAGNLVKLGLIRVKKQPGTALRVVGLSI